MCTYVAPVLKVRRVRKLEIGTDVGIELMFLSLAGPSIKTGILFVLSDSQGHGEH